MFDRALETLSALPALITYLDSELRFRFVNDAQRVWHQRFPDGVIGKRIGEVVPAEMMEMTEGQMRAALAGNYVEHEFDAIVRGEPRSFRISYSPDRDRNGNVIGLISLTTDLTERRKAEQDLRNSQRTFDGAFRNAVIGKAVVDLDGRCSRVNDALGRLLGYEPDELSQMHFRDFTHPDDIEADIAQFQALLTGDGEGYQIEKRYFHRDGSIVHVLLSLSVVRDDDGLPLQFVSEIVDITERKVQQELDHHQALTDPLTGLLNRRGFDAAVEAALVLPDGQSNGIGILAIDLDRFKPVNDKFGHAVGDALLIEAGHRLAATVRSIDCVARLGGDEFAVLLTGCSHEQTGAAAARVVTALAAPYLIADHEVIVSASVGAIFTAAEITDFAKFLRQADEELYRAKDAGRGCWRLSGIAA